MSMSERITESEGVFALWEPAPTTSIFKDYEDKRPDKIREFNEMSESRREEERAKVKAQVDQIDQDVRAKIADRRPAVDVSELFMYRQNVGIDLAQAEVIVNLIGGLSPATAPKMLIQVPGLRSHLEINGNGGEIKETVTTQTNPEDPKTIKHEVVSSPVIMHDVILYKIIAHRL